MNMPKRLMRGKDVKSAEGNLANKEGGGKSKYYSATEPTVYDEFGEKPKSSWGSNPNPRKKMG